MGDQDRAGTAVFWAGSKGPAWPMALSLAIRQAVAWDTWWVLGEMDLNVPEVKYLW